MGNEIRNGEFGKQVGSAEPVINQVGQQEGKMVYGWGRREDDIGATLDDIYTT